MSGQALFLRHAAVVGGDGLFAQALGKITRDALRHAPRVDENQCGLVQQNQLGQAAIHFLPNIIRHDGNEQRLRQLKGKIALAHMAGIDDGAGNVVRLIEQIIAGPHRIADQEFRHQLDRLLCGGQADAGESAAG